MAPVPGALGTGEGPAQPTQGTSATELSEPQFPDLPAPSGRACTLAEPWAVLSILIIGVCVSSPSSRILCGC